MSDETSARHVVLKNKPLVEAIFEMRWGAVQSPVGGAVAGPGSAMPSSVDPYYRFAIGNFWRAIVEHLPHYERLPAATVPEEMVPYIVQHRFRKGQDKWPLAQIGPGVVTYNETDDYEWAGFAANVIRVADVLRNSYPDSQAPKPTWISLKYVDAFAFDFTQTSALTFLEKLKIQSQLGDRVLEGLAIDKRPVAVIWRTSLRSSRPRGVLTVQVASALKDGRPAMVLETVVEAGGDEVPPSIRELAPWLEDAHSISSDVFFRMIEGELRAASE